MKRSKSKRTATVSKGRKSNASVRRETGRSQPDKLTVHDIDWDTDVSFNTDPKLTESIRTQSQLKQITLRIGVEQIAEARRVAQQTGVPYQKVLRRWLAEGASLSRAVRNAG